ncbi:light harvesting complex protein [Tribonema minus]|uniref:Light harvesting complex protein n=1 Tax=Tribonema minus TaxID=303371 RepID=A0A835ZCB2_9STRA|nr:light harvesting complex protein [Tribonema minus]
MQGAATAIACAALVGSAAAFNGAFAGTALARTAVRSSSALSMEFAGGLLGADGPEPTTKNFDPLGLAEKNPDAVLFYREAELKHGRIAMLAVLGMVVPNFVRLPGDIYQGVSVVEAHNAMVEKGPMVQLLFWLSLFEIITAPLTWNMQAKDREPGDFSLDPLGFCKDPEKKKRYQLSELKNGRLAMLAFSGMITQAVLTGHGFPYLY